MPIMTWKPEYSVGVQAFDEQHRIMIELINDLYDSMSAGNGVQALEAILKELVRYTETHFNDEERAFKRTAYPESAAHIADHKALTLHVMSLQNQLNCEKLMLPIETYVFLKQWLNNHILEADKKYTAHLNRAGIR